MNAPQCTPRSPLTQPAGEAGRQGCLLKQYPPLCLFELRVPLDKLFRAASREAHREAAVFVVALHAHNRSNAEARMTNFAAKHGIGIAAASCSGTQEGTLSRRATRGCLCLLRSAAHTTQELFRRI